MPTVPELIVERARDAGLRHFFGLPSSGVLLPLLDAGRRMGVEIVSSAHHSPGLTPAAALIGLARGISLCGEAVSFEDLAVTLHAGVEGDPGGGVASCLVDADRAPGNADGHGQGEIEVGPLTAGAREPECDVGCNHVA